MISPRHFLGLLLTSFLFVSCSPFPRNHGTRPAPNPAMVPDAVAIETPKTVEQLKEEADREKARIRANKKAAERRAALRKKKAEDDANDPTVTPPESDPKPVTTGKRRYPTALPIHGRPGTVYNPWTNAAVDVKGIPSGQLVRDPKDGNPDHVFRVP